MLNMFNRTNRAKRNTCYSRLYILPAQSVWLVLGLFGVLSVMSLTSSPSVLAAGSADPNTNIPPLELQLSLNDQTSKRVLVLAKLQHVELRSAAQHSIEFLPWSTPFSSFVDSAIFIVSRDGVAVPYQGLQLKRPAPTAGDFLTLAPDAILENELDISMSYDFCQQGHYRIHFAGQLMQRDATALRLASNTLEFVVTDQQFCP